MFLRYMFFYFSMLLFQSWYPNKLLGLSCVIDFVLLFLFTVLLSLIIEYYH